MAAADKRDISDLGRVMVDWLSRRMPDATQIELPSMQPVDGGASSETLFLNPVVTRGGERRQYEWVLRIEATRHQVYQDPSVERQFRIMEAVARQRADVPVPRTLWVEPDPSLLGAPFFVMERVAGAVPHERYHSQGVLFDASPAQREAMWLSGIRTMAAIHALDPTDFAFLGRPELAATGLEQEIAVWDAYLAWADVPDHPVLLRARRWLADHVPARRPSGLAWGDARLGNMIFRDCACVAVLDWETASLGGAETDLGWWLYYDWWIAEGSGMPRLEGVHGREETIRAWEEFAGRRADAIEWYEMFGTYRFAIISERAIALAAQADTELAVMSGDANPAIVRLRDLLG
jgi:aminoglycoside phosphotransferase (APT) family kinase protein